MSDNQQLWGWLGQGDQDPLEGKQEAERLLLDIAQVHSFVRVPVTNFDPGSLRQTRLSKDTIQLFEATFGTSRVSIDAFTRASFSLGQSYPDQLKRRAGAVENPVDAVVQPGSKDEALCLLNMATQHNFAVMAAGGATNVTGGFSVVDPRPVVVADMGKLNRVLEIDETNLVVEVEAGIGLSELEKVLGAKGFTLGHFPQSFHGATIGGSLSAHGSGQRSNGYGRVSELLLSATLATPTGLWETERYRDTATGPWLGGLICGSEGLFGLLVSARLKIKRKPEYVEDRGWFMPSLPDASKVVRELVQSDVGLSMIRVSDSRETQFLSQFRLAMKGLKRANWVERMALKVKRVPPGPALIIAGYEGAGLRMPDIFVDAERIFKKAGAISLGKSPGASWRKGRYDLPYLRESLMRRGFGVDTFETTVPWNEIDAVHRKVVSTLDQAINSTLKQGRGIVFCHLSHSYPHAACLYFTAIFPQNENPLNQWQIIKRAVMDAFSECGASASHHHGVGSDHAVAVRASKGEVGMAVLRGLKGSLDPDHILVSGMSQLLDEH